jgi:hypothetical protein
MKYINAAEVLPDYLIAEIQKHINGEVIYIPAGEERSKWGEKMDRGNIFKIETFGLNYIIKRGIQ